MRFDISYLLHTCAMKRSSMRIAARCGEHSSSTVPSLLCMPPRSIYLCLVSRVSCLCLCLFTSPLTNAFFLGVVFFLRSLRLVLLGGCWPAWRNCLDRRLYISTAHFGTLSLWYYALQLSLLCVTHKQDVCDKAENKYPSCRHTRYALTYPKVARRLELD